MTSGTHCDCKYYGICWILFLIQFIWLIWPFLFSLQCSILMVEMYGQKVWCWSITAEDWNDDVAREQPPDLDYFAPIVVSSSSLVLVSRAEILTVVINLFLSIKFTHFLGSHVMQFIELFLSSHKERCKKFAIFCTLSHHLC